MKVAPIKTVSLDSMFTLLRQYDTRTIADMFQTTTGEVNKHFEKIYQRKPKPIDCFDGVPIEKTIGAWTESKERKFINQPNIKIDRKW